MKLPFDFATKLLFRLVLPGATLAAVLMPLLLAANRALGANLAAEYVFIVAALVGGWVILLSDMPIYMLFEGRRFWPERLHDRFIRREARRLAGHQRRATALEEKARRPIRPVRGKRATGAG